MAILRKSPLLDPVWYRQSYPDLRDTPTDVARHYLEHGAAEGRNPGPQFNTAFYLQNNPDAASSGLNPLVHFILHGQKAGVASGPPTGQEVRQQWVRSPDALRREFLDALVARRSAGATEAAASPGRPLPEEEEFARGFDVEFYLESNPDVCEAGINPIVHYLDNGWIEGRDPAPWFGTRYYLKANADVAAAGVNPFWHYIASGAKEGRPARRETDARRRLLEHLDFPETERKRVLVPDRDRIDEDRLDQRLVSALQSASGIVCSISHTCYPSVTAGTELFIGDEQARLNSDGFTYIHISPVYPSNMTFDGSAADECWIVIDGEKIGVASYATIARALRTHAQRASMRRIFVVHSAQGHSTRGLIAICEALDAAHAYYWLHNYSSVCYGDNLLRNNILFCQAPPIGSVACDICIFGGDRERHVGSLKALFDIANFVVVAPSEAARDIWSRASDLPRRSVVVVEHCRLVGAARRPHRDVRPGPPVRVGFLGYPVMHKGWTVFERIVSATRGDSAYQFFHFASAKAIVSTTRIEGVAVDVSRDRRDEMTRALTTHAIDVVVIPALWPETFSYTTFEALAAGCDVLTLADSGNVAAKVSSSQRGRVFPDEESLVGFFTSHQVVDLVRIRASQPNAVSSIVHCGTTAALVADGSIG
ncbi:hypothetical protein DFR50_13821 [Roseiarcus fermentans]|uniref:Glycosyltransferase involved in cell wall biosynthesis n=1 Tax=Roseiarcus fermentans TaxID=1473586 RepID=A0A366EQF5_9HYPH|nr:hypothetical protein DFR50_13821 [Roseiarcus fermentans]